MAKSPLILAALAKAAAPAIDLVQVHPLHGSHTGLFDSALLKGSNGQDYVVRTPASTAGSLELDIETQVLRLLTPEIRARLPFKVTTILGETRDAKRNRVVVFEYLYGQPTTFERVAPGGTLSGSIATAIASIHALDSEVFRSAGLPEFSASETAKRLMNELDAVSSLGLVPPILLSRWEQALEDVNLFRYQPTVVHGELSGDTVLQANDTVYSVLNWGALHIGDPAEDFSWIASVGLPELLDSIRLTYFATTGSIDATIAQRATLYSEIAHARWLLHGKNTGDQDIIDDAVAQLELVAAEVAEGLALPLSASAVASVTAVAGGFVSATEEAVAEEVMSVPEIADEISALPVGAEDDSETQAVATEAPAESGADIEVAASLPEPTPTVAIDVVDDRTKEIELPEKTDNELF